MLNIVVQLSKVYGTSISIPYQHQLDVGGILTGTDEHAALELVTKAKTALVDSGLLFISHALYCKTKPQSIFDKSVLELYEHLAKSLLLMITQEI